MNWCHRKGFACEPFCVIQPNCWAYNICMWADGGTNKGLGAICSCLLIFINILFRITFELVSQKELCLRTTLCDTP